MPVARIASFVAALCIFAASPAAFAGTPYLNGPPPKHRLVYRSLTVARYNAIGLLSDFRLFYRYRLFYNEKLALRDNFLAVGINPAISPAFGRVAAMVEVQPLSVLTLWASYEFVGYFGAFNVMRSFRSAGDDYSDTELKRRRAYVTWGTQFNTGANLLLKFGPVVIRNQFRAMYADAQLRDGDRVFYDLTFDIAAPNRGWFINHDADLLYKTDFGLLAGVRYTITDAFYGPEHVRAGESYRNDANGPMQRLGPFVAYTWRERDGAMFNAPTVFLIVNWWLQHRWRTGADVNQALPFIAAGFQFAGDLLGGDAAP